MRARFDLEFTDDPSAFLVAAESYLAADPVVSSVIASVTARMASAPRAAEGAGPDPVWWVVVRDRDRAVVGVAMRTAPFEPRPAYVLPMPDEAASAIARAVHDRGETLGGVNGALPAARIVAEETARLGGGAARVHEHMRLFELGDLVVPPAPPGRLRRAGRADADLCLAWFRDFGRAAAEQAGRSEPHVSAADLFTLDEMVVRMEEGVWLWEDADGRPVSLAAAAAPAHGVTRIGPVYTPAADRRRGYASAAVAGVAQGYAEQGVRVCLFTDQANPTSNRIYQAIGFRAVVDMENLLVG